MSEESLVREFKVCAAKLANKIGFTREEREDMAQEAIIKMVQTYRAHPEAPIWYIRAVMYNACIDVQRRTIRNADKYISMGVPPDFETVDPWTNVDNSIVCEEILGMCGTERDARILDLKAAGFSDREIGSMCGANTPSTAKTWRNKAISSLQISLAAV